MVMRRAVLLVIAVSILCLAGFGLYHRSSHTDYTADEDRMLEMTVPAWLDEINPQHMEFLSRSLPDSPIILKVEGSDDVIHEYYQNIQRVKVLQVYRGDDLQQGEDIFIAYGMDQYDFNEERHHTGFVNYCKPEREYLVFLERRIEGVQKHIDPLYEIVSFIIAPVFAYEPVEHVIVPGVSMDEYYVPFREVRENDFFAGDQEALKNWLALNEALTAKYP